MSLPKTARERFIEKAKSIRLLHEGDRVVFDQWYLNYMRGVTNNEDVALNYESKIGTVKKTEADGLRAWIEWDDNPGVAYSQYFLDVVKV